MNQKLISLRCTIFVPQFMTFNLDFVKSMLDLFGNDYIPVILPNQIPEIGQVTADGFVSPVSWRLVQTDKNMFASFVANKIDIVCSNPIQDKIEEQEFIDVCADKFVKLQDLLSTNYTRLAYAPIYSFPLESENLGNFLKITSFSGTDLSSFSLNNTFLKKEIINKKEVWINYVINLFSNGKDQLNMQLDINTNISKKNSFDKQEVQNFFSTSKEFAQQVKKLYFGDNKNGL